MKGISVLVAFMCIAASGRRLFGKCLTAKESQEMLRAVSMTVYT